MSRTFILGTRGSDLALAQARLTQAALETHGTSLRIEVIKTIGDKRPDLKLSEFSQGGPGGEPPVVDKGIFTKELEEALARHEIDFAVHSLKDVPTELDPAFEICATLPRAEVPDLLLTRESFADPSLSGAGRGSLAGRTLATSSVRRARQLRWLCPGVKVVDIRGNVPTRIRKLLETPDWHGILLARAGLERLGIYHPGEAAFDFEGRRVHACELDPDAFLPAAGQGAVAMEIRSDDAETREALARINHAPTFTRVVAERAFLARLQAGCQTPVGARTWFEDGGATLAMAVRVFDEDLPEAQPFEAVERAPSDRPEVIADRLMERLRDIQNSAA